MARVRPLAVTLLFALAGASVAFAQGAGPATSATGTAAATTPSASASDSKPARPVGGYSYSDPKPVKGQQQNPPPVAKRAPQVAKATGPVATLPGFETLGDGSTRVFVQLTQNVQVEERKAKGTLTYVLKGAHVTIHNNTNPLVTVHFNTPVNQARLRPAGNDLLLVIDLRAAASPAWKMNAGKDGTAILQVDFPKGNFLPEASKDKS
jgi:hypothetical protein